MNSLITSLRRRCNFVFAFRLFCLAACLCSATTIFAQNPIQIENSKPGTPNWRLTNPARTYATFSRDHIRDIEGYASSTSVDIGESIDLFVNSFQSPYQIEFFRLGWYGGAGGRHMAVDGSIAPIERMGQNQDIPLPDANGMVECNWQRSYQLTIPDDWVSGVYVAKLTTIGSGDDRQSYIMFVVRDDARPSDFLFQSSVTTFQAYNYWGGRSLYEWGSNPAGPRANKVSFNRPYVGNPNQNPGVASGVGAGEFLTNIQPYENPVLRAGWEYNMVRWLEKEGYDVSYSTNVDTHASGNLLRRHRAFLSVGHDEYWSWEMRANVEAARDAGVSLGFFSSNTCFWQIRFEPSSSQTGYAPNRTMVCYKRSDDPEAPSPQRTTTKWRELPVSRPEDALLGVMYDEIAAIPITEGDVVATCEAPWTCEGINIEGGDHIFRGLLGYEADRRHGTQPANTQRVGNSGYNVRPDDTFDVSEMTVYTADSGATVFATGSMQWSWGLDNYNADSNVGPALRTPRVNPSHPNPPAQQFTRNVLARFTRLKYYPLPRPVRLLDTRPGQPDCDALDVPLMGGLPPRTLNARVTCDGVTIPANAQAIVGNATVVNNLPGATNGFITLYPTGVARPDASNLNYVANQIVPNAFTSGLGNDGALDIYASSTTDFIVDVTGYYAPPPPNPTATPLNLYYHALPTPIRLLDTRTEQPACDAPGEPLAGDVVRTQAARITCNGVTIPTSARAIVGNATVVNNTPGAGSGFITLYPSGVERPTVSNLNYTAGQIVPNAFTVGLGADGAFNIYAQSSTNFIVDVVGYYSDQETDVNGAGQVYFSLLHPVRLLDTRPGPPNQSPCDRPGAPLIGGDTRTATARSTSCGIPRNIPNGAQAVVGNATAINTVPNAESGFITLFPSDVPRPTVSNLNYVPGQIVPNAFTVSLRSGDGAFNIYASSTTHFIVDLAGYFAQHRET